MRHIKLLFFLAFVLPVPADRCALADDLNVNVAIQNGVAYLKSKQSADGTWRINHPLGATALAGMTLLESGVPASDPSVSKAVNHVRANAQKSQHTYSVALAIMLLDRAGKSSDRTMIRRLGERLRDAQLVAGDWGYTVPMPHKVRNPNAQRGGRGDHSNTQFAVLGLWVARRHGVDVDQALSKTGKYFESNFKKSTSGGGWGYKSGNTPTPPMTCAGLIGMAAYYGVQASLQGAALGDLRKLNDAPAGGGGTALNSPSVQSGLNYIGAHLRANGNARGATDWYFVWSMERVAVIFNQPTIGGEDWYGWGVERILKAQNDDGSWNYRWGSVPETCFVLLFLNRANVAPDLTKLVGGPSTLRGGVDTRQLNQIARAAAAQQQVQTESTRDAASLLTALVKSEDAAQQAQLIKQLEQAKGKVYSQALAAAIPRLTGDAQSFARDALASRFQRMTARTLRAKFTDSDVETRVAAIRAAAVKKETELVPDLVEFLVGDVVSLRAEAHKCLREITGQDFGPSPEASTVERFLAKQRWEKWLRDR